MVGYQLNRKQGERSAGLPAFKPGNGDFLFLEGVYLYGIPPVGLPLVVAAIPSTERTPRTNNGIPVNLSFKICFFVFPNIGVCVMVRYLYFGRRRRTSVASLSFFSFFLLVWFVLSILYLTLSSPLISSVYLSCNSFLISFLYNVGINSCAAQLIMTELSRIIG